MPWQVFYFPNVSKFVNKLSLTDRARLKSVIERLEKNGPYLRQPFSKKIVRNLFELRIKGQDSYRIFYTVSGNKFYLVNIFKKKSQQTPRNEIKKSLDMIKQLI